MGDSFFKIFFISCFVLLFLAGGIMFLQFEQESADKREVRAYLDSRGKAPVPRAWRGKIGDGI